MELLLKRGEVRSVLALYSKQKSIECVEEEVNGHYENTLAKEF